MTRLNAAIIGLGTWGRVLVNALDGVALFEAICRGAERPGEVVAL